MLSERYANPNLKNILIPRENYRPYPTWADRSPWDELPAALRDACLAAGERRLGMEWPSLPALVFMEFRRDGNRSHYEQYHFERRKGLADLVLAECVEGKGRFLDDIINGAWCICEESFWGVSAHSDSNRFPGSPLPDTADRIIDLFAGETGALLAWAHYLLAPVLDRVAPVVPDRIRREVKERILDPYLNRTDFWWMALDPGPVGVNNWNPWCNSNCLVAALILEDDPDRRVAAVDKALHSMDRFIHSYHADGGCDEGPGYWARAGASLFDCLDLLYGATGGTIDLFAEPIVANIGRYLYRVFIHGDYFINFADGGARLGIPADLVYRYGRSIGDTKMMFLGSSTHHARSRESGQPWNGGECLLRSLPALFNFTELDSTPAAPPYVRDVWMDGIQVMAAREQEGSPAGLYLAAKGGHNAESHNHNDVGQFILYCDGEPVFVDVGVETYTAKTFSPQRYEIWTMQSAYHNLPTVNGASQAPGLQFAARDVSYAADDGEAQFSLDIAGAYGAEGGVQSWHRTVRLRRGALASVRIEEKFQLAGPGEVSLNLITPRQPEVPAAGVLLLPGKRAIRLEFPGEELDAVIEPIEITDGRLHAIWGNWLYRIVLTSQAPVAAGRWVLNVTAC